MINDSLFSSKDRCWETPQGLFNQLNKAFIFSLDVCATSKTAKCEKYYDVSTNGLIQNWDSCCFMNPPYGREQIKWIHKANSEYLKHSSTIVCLIPARPDTKTWQEIIFKNARAICFIKGRLKFGDSKDSAPFPSAIVIFSNKITAVQKELLDTLGQTYIKEAKQAL
jgi:site-specific DNA-methyltransferase (adenine-specific)